MTDYHVNTNFSGTGTPILLATGDTYSIFRDVIVESTNMEAVESFGNNVTFRIYGTLIGATQGIRVGDDPGDVNNLVRVLETGTVYGSVEAIKCFAGDTDISNEGGTIHGYRAIVFSSTTGAGSTVYNTGTISSEFGTIWAFGGENMTITNKGTITSFRSSSVLGGAGVDKVFNSGTLKGGISFFGNDDYYEGKGGKVWGVVRGDGGNDTLRGGAFVDRLDGGADNDSLMGRGGIDELTGGAGGDRFYYNALSEAGDNITDFTTADTLLFKRAAFGNLAAGTLAAANFVANAAGAATTTAHRFVYDTDDDQLWYDANGSAANGRTLILDFAYDVAAFSRSDITLF